MTNKSEWKVLLFYRLKNKIKILWPVLCIFIILPVLLSGCAKPLFIPGATLGYYIWEDSEDNIHIAWSADRKDNSFKGSISTDGRISEYELIDFEEEDSFTIAEDEAGLDFDATLSSQDYSDEIVFNAGDYRYIEFELKINDAYDLSRTNLGNFLNSPPDGVFKITKGYFDKVEEIPFYRRPPFSGFFEKLNADIRFTIFYLFIAGVVIIELIRITVLRRNKKNNWYLFVCYGVLIMLMAGVYFILKIIV